jgi:hypothetical protein
MPPSTHLPCLIDKSKWVWVISSAFACEFASSWHLGEHWLRDSCYSWWLLILVHLPVICEGCCVFPSGAPKATLVNCLCHWVTSLVVGSCGALGELGFDCQLAAKPRSGSRHNGDVACWQAREPWEKNYVSPLWLISWISPVDWSSYYCDWFIPRRGGIKITYLSFTFRKLVVTNSLV